jgi:predicted PurR-regulated permease PerM
MSARISRPTLPTVPHPPPMWPADDELPKVPTPAPLEPAGRKRRIVALGVVLSLSFLAVARLVAPVWVGIAFGSAMAFTAQPLFRRACVHIRRRWLAALATTAVTALGWIAVGGGTLYVLSREAMNVAGVLRGKIERGTLQDLIGPRGARIVDGLGLSRDDVMQAVRARVDGLAGSVADVAALVLSTTGAALLGVVIASMTMYYVLMEWPALTVRLERVLPLDPRHTRLLILEFRDVARSAMLGSIVTAIVQGLLGGVGYTLAGVPHATTFALLTFVGSFLPAIGTALVWAPLCTWLVVQGNVGKGIALLVFSLVIVVGLCDYVIRPRLVGKEEHPLLTLLALVGGLEVFGLPGLLVGPIVMALFLAILRIYERESALETERARVAQPPDVPEKL